MPNVAFVCFSAEGIMQRYIHYDDLMCVLINYCIQLLFMWIINYFRYFILLKYNNVNNDNNDDDDDDDDDDNDNDNR